MTNIFYKYTTEQLKDFVDPNKCLDWPADFREWITEDMAYEVFDSWVENHDEEDFYNLAQSVLFGIIGE